MGLWLYIIFKYLRMTFTVNVHTAVCLMVLWLYFIFRYLLMTFTVNVHTAVCPDGSMAVFYI